MTPTGDGRAQNNNDLKAQLSDISIDVKTLIGKFNELVIRYETRHVELTANVNEHERRINDLEKKITDIQDEIEAMNTAIKPLIFQAKILGWVAAIGGATIIAFIWSIIIHAVTIVVP